MILNEVMILKANFYFSKGSHKDSTQLTYWASGIPNHIMKILPRSKIPEALFHFLKESIEDSNDCASDLLGFTGIPNQVFSGQWVFA